MGGGMQGPKVTQEMVTFMAGEEGLRGKETDRERGKPSAGQALLRNGSLY